MQISLYFAFKTDRLAIQPLLSSISPIFPTFVKMAAILRLWQNRSYRFIILLLGVFGLMYYFNEFYIGITAPGGHYVPFLDEHLNYISGLRFVLIQTAEWILNLLGYSTFTTEYWLRVAGRGGVVVVYSCLGFGVMSFFTAFVIAWPAKLKSKLWFLPLGLVIIQLLNLCRFVLLPLYWKGSGLRGQVDHHNIFNGIVYLILIIVIYFWIRNNEHDKNRSFQIQ